MKATAELHGTVAEKYLTIEMLQDVLRDFHLESPVEYKKEEYKEG